MNNQQYEHAKAQVDRFVRRFDESYRKLAYLASLPFIFTPELINYLRNNYLRGEVPWVAEVDLLLSDLAIKVSAEQFRMDSEVREYLLIEMKDKLGNDYIQDVARSLLSYINYIFRNNPKDELDEQRLAVMVLIDEKRADAVREIENAIIKYGVTALSPTSAIYSDINKAEIERLTRLVAEIAPRLVSFPETINFAHTIRKLLIEKVSIKSEPLIEAPAKPDFKKISKYKILFLAANPKDITRLRLDDEVREIKQVLRMVKQRELFKIEQREAVRIRDLRRALLDCEPQIVHFSGHGEADGIVLEDETGKSELVKPEVLASLFELFSDQIECVLLNACFSESQAKAINKYIPHIIEIKREVDNRAASDFFISFYKALFTGKTYEQSFNFGLTVIQLRGIPQYLHPTFTINPEIIYKTQLANEKIKTNRSRIYFSYKRNVDPDESVALNVAKALEDRGHYVFLAQIMPASEAWVKRINQEIRDADYLVTFLSGHSISSEMVKEEIEIAYNLAKTTGGKPKMLPVRLNYRAPFQYPVDKYLNHINWALWDGDEDTPRLIDELLHAIAGTPLPINPEHQKNIVTPKDDGKLTAPSYNAQPIAWGMSEGTINIESKFYVARPSDAVAIEAIKREGVTITIKAPRQMGKSSLLMRIMQQAQAQSKKVVFLDFQLFDKPALTNADQFYRQFCSWITNELGLDDRTGEYWNMNISNSLRCTRYMEKHLLKQIGTPLLLAMDEVETMFDADFRSDFFGMLRSWHNKRMMGAIWKNFDLALVTSTEPYQLIENLNQSPFNVGEVINLKDFTIDQVADLNERYGKPMNPPQIQHLMDLLFGHPYLTHRALYLTADGRITPDELFTQAADDRGPFGDHLRYHLFRIHQKKELVERLIQIIKHRTCADDWIFRRLEGVGLVRKEGYNFIPRCQLYENYFREKLNV